MDLPPDYTHLPLDILELIVDHIGRDVLDNHCDPQTGGRLVRLNALRDLSNISLSCKALLDRSRYWIFHSVTLRARLTQTESSEGRHSNDGRLLYFPTHDSATLYGEPSLMGTQATSIRQQCPLMFNLVKKPGDSVRSLYFQFHDASTFLDKKDPPGSVPRLPDRDQDCPHISNERPSVLPPTGHS